MNIQVFGTKKCFETKKAERYFRERNIPFQFVDLGIKGLSKGELHSVIRAVGVNALIAEGSKEYKKLRLDRIASASMREELLLKNTGLYKTPVVRNGSKATVGYQPEVWALWQDV